MGVGIVRAARADIARIVQSERALQRLRARARAR